MAICLPHARKVGNSHDPALRIVVEQHGVKDEAGSPPGRVCYGLPWPSCFLSIIMPPTLYQPTTRNQRVIEPW